LVYCVIHNLWQKGYSLLALVCLERWRAASLRSFKFQLFFPSIRVLQSYFPPITVNFDWQLGSAITYVAQLMKNDKSLLDELNTEGVGIAFDEMAILKGLSYSKQHGGIVGGTKFIPQKDVKSYNWGELADIDTTKFGTEQTQIATQAFQMFLIGSGGMFALPCGYHFTDTVVI